MTHDDAHTSHNHGFELPNAPEVVVRSDPRPWRAVAGVAVCLGLAGIVTGLVVARRQSASDAHITSDALQREELRDGWRALGAAAVREAQEREVDAAKAQKSAAPPANSANSQAAPPNVVIVNVPAQSATAAPPNVTNINLPNGTTRPSGVAPSDNWNYTSGYAPNQSVPPLNYSPAQGYLPLQTTYPLPPNTYTPPSNYAPQNSYGTTGNSVAPSVGNGSIPGAANNGLVGGTPTALPNGQVTPNLPPLGTSESSGQPSLPSGFSAP